MRACFERYPWIDRHRQVLLMTASGASYHEMALINQGTCLIQMNRGLEARRTIERALELHPDSTLAEGLERLWMRGAPRHRALQLNDEKAHRWSDPFGISLKAPRRGEA